MAQGLGSESRDLFASVAAAAFLFAFTSVTQLAPWFSVVPEPGKEVLRWEEVK